MKKLFKLVASVRCHHFDITSVVLRIRRCDLLRRLMWMTNFFGPYFLIPYPSKSVLAASHGESLDNLATNSRSYIQLLHFRQYQQPSEVRLNFNWHSSGTSLVHQMLAQISQLTIRGWSNSRNNSPHSRRRTDQPGKQWRVALDAAECTSDFKRCLFLRDLPSSYTFMVDSVAEISVIPPTDSDQLSSGH